MDWGTKFCCAFREIVKNEGARPVRFPSKSSDMNAHIERLVRSIQSDFFVKMIFFGKKSLDSAIGLLLTPFAHSCFVTFSFLSLARWVETSPTNRQYLTQKQLGGHLCARAKQTGVSSDWNSCLILADRSDRFEPLNPPIILVGCPSSYARTTHQNHCHRCQE